MTLEGAVIDLSGAFEYGQGYVALSRVRAFSGLFLLGINRRALEVHPEILSADGSFKEASRGAEVTFGKLSQKEQTTMEQNFIRACGGKVEKMPLKQKTAPTGKTFSVETIRQKYKNAYRPWLSEEDAQLKKMFEQKLSTKEMVEALGRQPGSIRSRLELKGFIPKTPKT